MTRTLVLALSLAAVAATAEAAPKKKPPPDRPVASPEQKEADRHFKSGVALFKESKFAEALAEFERAYEIAPHPTVLYNIAACHRELSHYGDAVKFYRRFLTEGPGKVPKARLDTAQTELDGILARIARVTITITGADGAGLSLDGNELGTMPLEMPLIVAPGEHKLVARAQGKKDAEKTLRVASGDEVEVALALVLRDAPVDAPHEVVVKAPPPAGKVIIAPPPKRFAIRASFGTNLMRAGDTGAPAVGVGISIGSRVELGADAVLVAYAVMPSLRIHLAGSSLVVDAIAAAPLSFPAGAMSETFPAGAFGLGLRYHASRTLAFKLDSYAAFAGKAHGTTLPTFLGGELWF